MDKVLQKSIRMTIKKMCRQLIFSIIGTVTAFGIGYLIYRIFADPVLILGILIVAWAANVFIDIHSKNTLDKLKNLTQDK